jgi:hypothetical protein
MSYTYLFVCKLLFVFSILCSGGGGGDGDDDDADEDDNPSYFDVISLEIRGVPII